MKKTKKLLVTLMSFVLLLATALNVVGCSGGGGGGMQDYVDDFDPNKQYNITFFGWGDAKEQNIYQRVIRDFMTDYPNVTVRYEATSAGSYLTALSNRINDLPDVFYMPDTEYLQYVASGRLLNLNNGVTETELSTVWDTAVNEYYYNPTTYQLGKSEGAGLFALPKDLGPYTLGYNKKLVQQRITANNLENDPDVQAVFSGDVYTWDNFVSAMKKLLAGTTDLLGVPYYELEHAVYSNNAQFFNEDATQSMITSDAFVDSLEFIATLAQEDIIPETGVTGVGSAAYESFYSGKSLMTFVGPWDFATIWSMNDFEVDIIPCPYGPGADGQYNTADDGKSTAFIGSMGYCIANKTLDRGTAGASLRLAKYLCMDETAQRRFYSLGQCIPNLKDMAYDEYVPNSLGVFEGKQLMPENRQLFVDIAEGFKDSNDKIGGKTRILYHTFYSDWRQAMEDELLKKGVWAGTNDMRQILEGYNDTFQAQLNTMYNDLRA